MIFINILAIVAAIGYLLIGAVTVTAIHQFHLASLRKSNFILLVLAGIFWPLVVPVLLMATCCTGFAHCLSLLDAYGYWIDIQPYITPMISDGCI